MAEHAQGISDREFYGLAHPLLRRRFYLALFFSMLLFPLIVIGLIIGTISLVVPAIALGLWISMRVLFAWLIGNTIVVSELNFPAIHAIAEDLKRKLGFRGKIYIFIYESKSFNAWMRHVFFRHAIFLNSEMLVAGVGEEEMRWIIGRFVGYLRARKQAGLLGILIRVAQRLVVFDLFLLPYERAMVYTGDRLALAALDGDILTAAAAMQKLAVGRELGYSINPEGLVAQLREVKGTLFGFLARVVSTFPHSAARYVDLIVFAKQVFPARYVTFEAMNPGLPKDIGRLVALPRAKPKPSANGLVADASPFRGWWLATGMAGAVAALVILASFGASIGWRWPDYYEPAFKVSNPTPQEVSIPASAAPVVDAPPSLDAPAPPLDNPAPQEIPAQPASPAPQEVTTPLELPAIVPPGPHLHAGTNGGWEPDAGCKWASNDTRDVTVVCE